jgi:hypothetical protein
MTPDIVALRDFASRYTAAWCSQNAQSVAAFFSEGGSLRVNAASAAVGRAAIAQVVLSFMTTFPDLRVRMDSVRVHGHEAEYHWTLTGTNTGGTGHKVRISGFETWRLDRDGLIASSEGHFDETDYRRQLERGISPENAA